MGQITVLADEHSNHNLPIGAEVEWLGYVPDWAAPSDSQFYSLGGDGDEVAIDPRDLVRDTFEVGDLAAHKSRDLDPRPVAEVSEDGSQIKLSIGATLTPWIPAAHYDRIEKKGA